jgi:hypothetical protein
MLKFIITAIVLTIMYILLGGLMKAASKPHPKINSNKDK